MLEQENYKEPNGRWVQNALPNATAALVLGIIAIVTSFCYGIFGVTCGIIGLVLANKDQKLYADNPGFYSASSLNTSNAGRVCSIIGLIIGGVILLCILGAFLFFGTTVMEGIKQGKMR